MIRDLFAYVAEKAVQKIQSSPVEPAFDKAQKWIGRSGEIAVTAANLARVGTSIAMYASQASAGKMAIRDPKRRLEFFTRNVGKYSRRALDQMNVEIEVHGYDPVMMAERNFLLVSNHLSYIDILVTSTVQPSVFVTSVDMREAFFLGPMSELGGSLFIERRHRGRIERDVNAIIETLNSGFHVLIYPEGTSGSGHDLLPFKKTLFNAAILAQKDILPIVLKYTHINGEPFGLENSAKICWHGDVDFASHFLGVMQLKSLKVEVHFLKPIPVTSESTRRELGEKTFKAIESVYKSKKSSTQ